MTAAIVTEGLTKFYGQVRGIEELDLEVRAGEVFGFLGPNGAGKTTTIRLLMDLVRPTAGRATVLGLDPQRRGVEVRRHVGYLPGELRLYPGMRGGELLDMAARLRGGVDAGYRAQLVERLELPVDRAVRTYSHGMRQKLGLLLALQHRPRLLILDEPTNGLDPLMQQELYGILREQREAGVTVFFSSHVLSEVERICERVAIVRGGRLVALEDIRELRRKSAPTVVMRFADPAPTEEDFRLPGVSQVDREDNVLTLRGVRDMDAVVKRAATHQVEMLHSQEPTLEEVFLSYYVDHPRDETEKAPS